MPRIYNIANYGAEPGTNALQNTGIQAAIDACSIDGGGTVSVPTGIFRISGILLRDGVTLSLESGAELVGSGECSDYPVYEVPAGVELRTDLEMIPYYPGAKQRAEYRRAMISAYGAHDIAVIGASGSVINGSDCWDPDGEEGFRGPHGIFFSNCRGITLSGYSIKNSGNFMHQLDNCHNLVMRGVTSIAGHDGIHLHCCSDILIENCVFLTGDDCIAGIDVNNLTVRNCELNTSCNVFRIGGTNITVERCNIHGPGIYPHRITVVRGKDKVLPREAGRHNTLFLFEYFSSSVHPAAGPARGWLLKDCDVKNIDRFLHFEDGSEAAIHSGVPLTELTIEDTALTGLTAAPAIALVPPHTLEVRLKNVFAEYTGNRRGDLFEPVPGLRVVNL